MPSRRHSCACSRDSVKQIRPPGRSRCRRPATGPTSRSALWVTPARRNSIRSVRKCSRASAWARRVRPSARSLRLRPFGWPRDAVDAALIALHRSQHLRVTLNGALVVPGQLDQNKIPKAEFRVDSAPLPVGDRLLVRGLIATLVACKNGEEVAKAPEFIQAVQNLAAAAGGPAPLPAPPSSPEPTT